MKTIKSNKSFDFDLEDFVQDEIDKKCKKKKNKKKKKSSKNKKSSHNKKGNKKKKKKSNKSLDNFNSKQKKQYKKDYKYEKSHKTFVDKVLSAINLDADVKINITDETIGNALLVVGGIVTSIITRGKK